MYGLNDFYNYCEENDVDVMHFNSLPGGAATIKDGEFWCVAIDFNRFCTARSLRGVTMHELGHLCTGALHKVCSPYQLVEQSEFRANSYAFQSFLPVSELTEAMRQGYVDVWQLADYFELPEEQVSNALYYWTECKGVDFNGDVTDTDTYT